MPTVVRVIARLNIGGPALHAILLTGGLTARGFTTRLVTGVVSPGEGDMTPLARDRGVEPTVLPMLERDPRPFGDLRALVAICRIVFAARPDVIHTHTAKAGLLGRLAGLLYNLAARLRGRPQAVICHTFHGHLFSGYFPGWITRLLLTGERVLARITDRVITVSEQMQEELTGVYRVCPSEKCTVVPLGLDFDWTSRLVASRGLLRGEARVGPDDTTVGIVGRLTAIKNHDAFLQAAAALDRPGLRFLVVGDGERRAELGALAARLGLDGRVVFTGWQRDPARIYADLDIVCLASLNEGTPVALIEAMAAGRPIVATDVGGVRDVMVGSGRRHPAGFEIFSNGILLPPGDPPTLAAALTHLIEGRAGWDAMGRCGQAWVAERYTQGRLLDDMERLYRDLLARRDG